MLLNLPPLVGTEIGSRTDGVSTKWVGREKVSKQQEVDGRQELDER